ncbi:MAG: lysine--tRNA ligase [Acidobacteria bacterium]|nr:lysine--tRNA ligase [Acidobacteriota bacterium]NIM60990.1 lysine--tRNA ligase [Acidobacteriota bacterium]NIO59958.1 lysine--tRNA ligase [Acidobacteriota bacterium]NIQ31030.1 lysine--tRNA ligase [Acidobacteriota bacterium]NIQ86158.1 lysine--tRNA ligase [Acidobacteriota bacterium]
MNSTEKSTTVHWVDRYASEIAATGKPAVVSSGISPSGEIHVGNMREVLTADAVYRGLLERGHPARFNYVADNFDPLRKVYPFLEPAVYDKYVGCPLSEIPCPCGEHGSYSEHFLEPFLAALNELGVEVEVERADQMYKSGRMTPWILKALEGRERIAAILKELTGKQVADDWSPFTPLCRSCGRTNASRVTGFSATDETVFYSCECGDSGDVPFAGGGKLVWRIDWPARWCMLGVTVEPFGKDHSTRGGSYDTGKRIIAEVFDGEAPFPIPYEWIRLKGKGDMSSSRGNVLSINRMLEVVPPEVLRYLVIRERPHKTIGFDPGLPLLQLVDEFDDNTQKRRDARAVELSRAGGFEPVGVPFKHLVVVGQAVRFDVDKMVETLRRNGFPELARDALDQRIPYAKRWLESFAPEDVKFSVQETLPEAAASLDETQRRFLGRLGTRLVDGMEGEQVHQAIYETAEEFAGTKPGDLFQAIYLSLLGKPRGPRAGWFIALLGPLFCKRRFEEAAGGPT